MTERLELSVSDNKPRQTARFSRRRRVVLLCFVAWTVFVALALWWLLRGDSGPSVYVIHEGDGGQQAAIGKFRAWSKADLGTQRVYPWVLLGPYVALIALWFPLERGRLRLTLALNLGACVGFVAISHAVSERTNIKAATVVFIRTWADAQGNPSGTNFNGIDTGPSGTGQAVGPGVIQRNNGDLPQFVPHWQAAKRLGLPPPELPRLGLLSMLSDLLAYCAIVGLAHSVHFYRRFREREHQALFLESNLAQARLQALRAQLQPHFLFNSLNAVAALLRRDARLAEATLLSLSELLRLALTQSEQAEVALREEMRLVQHYLEIQQIRFGDKLRVEQVIDPAALDCLVPTLLLQPVIENAIRHGIEPADNCGLVRVTAGRNDNSLVLTVEDDGFGLSNKAVDVANTSPVSDPSAPLAITPSVRLAIGSKPNGTGIGLANLRARLEALYGVRQKVDLAPRRSGGVIVRIEIPWRPAAAVETVNQANEP